MYTYMHMPYVHGFRRIHMPGWFCFCPIVGRRGGLPEMRVLVTKGTMHVCIPGAITWTSTDTHAHPTRTHVYAHCFFLNVFMYDVFLYNVFLAVS